MTEPRLAWVVDRVSYAITVLALMCVATDRFLWPAAVLCVLAWLMVRYSERRFSPWTDICCGLLLITSLVGHVVNPWPAESMVGLLRLVVALTWFDVLGHSRRRTLLSNGIVVMAAGAGIALVGLFAADWIWDKLTFIPSSIYSLIPHLSESIHPNVLAGLLAALCPLLVAPMLLAWGDLRVFWRWLYTATVGLLLAVMVLAQSRGALLALSLAMSLLFVLRWRRLWPFVLAFAGGGAALLLFGDAGTLLSSAGVGGLQTLQGRMALWRVVLRMIRDHWLTGAGFGGFRELGLLLYPGFPTSLAASHAHNVPLQVALDAGLFGLAAWLALVGHVLVQAIRGISVQASRLDRALAAGLVCSVVAILAHGLIDASLWVTTRPALMLWAVCGLAIGWHSQTLPKGRV